MAAVTALARQGAQGEDGPARGLSPRAERRLRLQEMSRAQLLDAAESVFADKGFDATSVKEIAERAELSVGSVYQLFESKRAIFRAVFQRRNRDGLRTLKAAVDAAGTPRDRLHRLVDATVDFYTVHRTFFLLFQRAIGGSWLNVKAGFDSRNFAEYLEFVEVPAGIFRQGVAEGVFCPLEPAGMAVFFTGIMQAYLLHEVIGLDRDPATSPPTIRRDELHVLIDRAFLAPPGG